MAVIMIPMGIPYVKKEDGAQLFKNHKWGCFTIGLTMVGISLFWIILWYFVIKDPSTVSPEAVAKMQKYMIWGNVVLIISPIVYLFNTLPYVFSKEYQNDFLNKLNRYDPKEMINLNELINWKKIRVGIAIWAIGFFLGIGLYILPIFWA